MDGFTLQRGRKLRDELLLHLGAFAVAAEAVGIHQLALPHREQSDGAYAALLLRA